MISDYTVSKKIDDKYVAMVTIKEGWKVAFSPAFKKEIKAWLNSPADDWLNLNLKQWDAKPGATQQPATQSTHQQAKQDGYQPAPVVLDDEIPFR